MLQTSFLVSFEKSLTPGLLLRLLPLGTTTLCLRPLAWETPTHFSASPKMYCHLVLGTLSPTPWRSGTLLKAPAAAGPSLTQHHAPLQGFNPVCKLDSSRELLGYIDT